jgi:hypothetical protein
VTRGGAAGLGGLVLGAIVACNPQASSSPAAGNGKADGVAPRAIPRASRVRPLVLRLASDDKKVALAARVDLRKWMKDRPLSTGEGVELLRACARTFPFDAGGTRDTPAFVIQALAETPRPEYRPVIEELFPRLRPDARAEALTLLSVIDDDAAAATFVRLLRERAGELTQEFSLRRLRENPHHGAVFFPRLLDMASHDDLADELYLTALDFCQHDELPADALPPRAPSLLAAYRVERDWLLPRQRPRGAGWVARDDYRPHRMRAEILLDLMACLPAEAVDEELARALALRDPRLIYFALTSLMAHGHDPAPAAVAAVAASAEMRNPLWERLHPRALTDLFPARYRTQAALAESSMVRWLVYPTELGQAPDRIELKEVFSIDSQSPDGILDYYLFRFRTAPPHWAAKRGWMAGVAGPFLRKEAPTTDAQGDTFSELERWDARTPDEHVGDLRELLAQWRRRKEEAAALPEGAD